MSNFTRLIATGEVAEGVAKRVQAAGQCVVVCNDAGTFYVTESSCPHAGGPLAGADVCEGTIVCPVHYWPWDLRTGLTDDNMPDLRLRIFPSEVRDGAVYADLSGGSPPSHAVDLDCRS